MYSPSTPCSERGDSLPMVRVNDSRKAPLAAAAGQHCAVRRESNCVHRAVLETRDPSGCSHQINIDYFIAVVNVPERPESLWLAPLMIIIEDFFPTILEVAGVRDARQIGGVIDGRSLVPLLRGDR